MFDDDEGETSPGIALPRGMGERGSWKPKRVPGRPITAEVACPKCGRRSSMADHSIDSKGEVTPGVMCPHVPCGWYAHLRLIGWGNEPDQVGTQIYYKPEPPAGGPQGA